MLFSLLPTLISIHLLILVFIHYFRYDETYQRMVIYLTTDRRAIVMVKKNEESFGRFVMSMGTFKHTFEKCEAGSQHPGLSRSRYITCLDCSNEVGLLFVWRDRPGEGLQQDCSW